jgi:hypothetical protein
MSLLGLCLAAACSPDDEPEADALPSGDTTVSAAHGTTPQPDGGTTATDAPRVSKGPVVEMGGSDDEGKGFVDWSSDKETPPLIHGIQGGEHVYFSVRVRDMNPKKMNLELSMTEVASGKAIFPTPPALKKFNQTLKKETVDGQWTGWYFKNGYIAFVHCPCLVSGKELKFDLVVTSKDGTQSASVSHTIVPGTKKVKPHWDGDCNDDEFDECKP